MYRKKIIPIVILLISILVLTGCEFTKSLSFKLDNGDKVKVIVKDLNDWKLKRGDNGFRLIKDEAEITGDFAYIDWDELEEEIEVGKYAAFPLIMKDDNAFLFGSANNGSGGSLICKVTDSICSNVYFDDVKDVEEVIPHLSFESNSVEVSVSQNLKEVIPEETEPEEELALEEPEEKLEESIPEAQNEETLPTDIAPFEWIDALNKVTVNGAEIELGKTTLNDIVKNFPYIEEYLKKTSEWRMNEYSEYFPSSVKEETKEEVWALIDLIEHEMLEVKIWDNSEGKKVIGDIPISEISFIPGDHPSESKVEIKGYINSTDMKDDVFKKLGYPTYSSTYGDRLSCSWESGDYTDPREISITFDKDGHIWSMEVSLGETSLNENTEEEVSVEPVMPTLPNEETLSENTDGLYANMIQISDNIYEFTPIKGALKDGEIFPTFNCTFKDLIDEVQSALEEGRTFPKEFFRDMLSCDLVGRDFIENQEHDVIVENIVYQMALCNHFWSPEPVLKKKIMELNPDLSTAQITWTVEMPGVDHDIDIINDVNENQWYLDGVSYSFTAFDKDYISVWWMIVELANGEIER